MKFRIATVLNEFRFRDKFCLLLISCVAIICHIMAADEMQPTPPERPADAPGIPEALKPFEGKTARELFLGHGAKPEQLAGTAGMLYGFMGDMGVPIPDFAKEASKQFWKNFLRKGFDAEENVRDAGVVSRLLELVAGGEITEPQSKLEQKVIPAAQPMADILERGARKLSPEQTAEFYAGRADGEKFWTKIQDPNYLKMIKRAPLYIVLAVAWMEFEKFKSQAEAERWLRKQNIIGENFDSGEVRAVFRVVGLSYGKRPGRPKKIKTDA